MEVSRSLLRRAMLILSGLTKEALRRGWEVVPYPEDGDGRRGGIAIKVRGHLYPVEMQELTEQLPLSPESSRRRPPTARSCLDRHATALVVARTRSRLFYDGSSSA